MTLADFLAVALRVYLAIVLVAAAGAKLRHPDRGSALADYGVFSRGFSLRVMRAIAPAEIGVAAALLVAPAGGTLAAGLLFLSFGHVQLVGLASGYRGSCGCSASKASVSIVGVVRAYAWGVAALVIASWSLVLSLGETIGVVTAACVLSGLTFVCAALLAPGPRMQRRQYVTKGG